MARGEQRRHASRTAAFVDAQLPWVWGYASGVLDDPAQARDLARTVLGGVDPGLLEDDEQLARRLVLTRARRAAADARRDGAPAGAHREAAPADDDAEEGRPVAAPDAPAWLLTGMRRIDPEARSAVVLVDVLGVPVEEAAAICGVTEDELVTWLRRAHEGIVAQLAGGRT